MGGKAWHQNAAAALGQHRMDADAEAEAVEKRHGSQHFVPDPVHGVGSDKLLREGVKVFVGQYNALGGAGGAAGIQNNGRIIGFPADFILIEAVV